MDITKFKEYIDNGYSTYEISRLTNKSQTAIRYWLKKFKLETVLSKKLCNCLSCGCSIPLGRKKFCSETCRHKSANKKHQNYTAQQQRGHSRKIELVNLAGGKCIKCGYSKNYAALQFHHVNSKNKSGALDVRFLSTKSWEWCLNEFRKCELLCSNCHLECHNPKFNCN